jgi:hypothetical protein
MFTRDGANTNLNLWSGAIAIRCTTRLDAHVQRYPARNAEKSGGRNMVSVKHEITKEEYEKAQAEGVYSIIPDSIAMGYGCYGASVSEHDGKYYLFYDRGDSCD